MGASNSRMVEEDKALLLCRERKKFIGQALDGRCNLAATHISYIEILKLTGTSLRTFVEPEGPLESSMYTSTCATPEPLVLTDKSVSQFSFSSPFSQANGNISTSSTSPGLTHYQTNHMKFRGTFSRKVEEKPSEPQTVSVGSGTPESTTPRSIGRPKTPVFETTDIQDETPPWDYFGLFHPVENHYSTQEQMEFNQNSEYVDEVRQLREEEGISELEGEDEKLSSHRREESLESEDEFDEPSTDTLVRSFENVNRVGENVTITDPPAMPSTESMASESKVVKAENKSPDLTPLRDTSTGAAVANDVKKPPPIEENEVENKICPKDFFSSMKDIEYLFCKASESGKEVPWMLEANKFHFRPIFSGKESGSVTSSLLKSCFSCGEDPSQVQEEPPETSVKYLTWHRSTSSCSASSRNLMGANPIDDVEDLTKSLLDSLSMVSRTHASTLDRLYAWEKKLYDEVKASQRVRKKYDYMCRLLRQQESKGEKHSRIEKTRAVVKDLHSRIRVAIHRIDSVSKKIEELRDIELQPQLEELVEGLKRMWEVMLDCHKLQFDVLSVAYNPTNIKISSFQSDLRRQITIELQNNLNSLSSSFTKWIDAQKAYVEAINKWLFKCVSLPKTSSSKKKRRMQTPPLRNYGPPIYVTCGVWLDKFDNLPTKPLTDSMKCLASEISHFLPRQEKNHANKDGADYFDTGAANLLVEEQRQPVLDQFRISFAGFLCQLSNFAELSVNMFADLQKEIEKAKSSYEHSKSQEK